MDIPCKEGYVVDFFWLKNVRKNTKYRQNTMNVAPFKFGRVNIDEINDNSFVAKHALKPGNFYGIQTHITPRSRKKGMRPHFSAMLEYFFLTAENKRIKYTYAEVKQKLLATNMYK